MAALSASFTLGKASAPNGANVEHNNREFIAKNVDPTRIADNITYVKEDVQVAYNELFGEALVEYNSRQKRADRKIDDYFSHIENGKREEAYYELIVQFGCSKSAPIGSENGEVVKKLLDEYMHEFNKRNPNMHIFNAVLHADEASYHLHINVIPFYTQGRTNGLSKGVSMRAALDEQGFTNKHKMANSLVAWENSEFAAMEQILKRNGLNRDIKNALHGHKTVDEYKESEDEKKIKATQTWKNSNVAVEQLIEENNILRSEKQKLTDEKFSPWKSFYYSIPEKQSFVMAQLISQNIPYRETENGIEAQECYVEQIRKLEKEFKPVKTSNRVVLREVVDKLIMQSKSYDDVLQRLRDSDYEVKQGKYVAVRHKYDSGFIRLKSLGENYSEQAIKNRLEYKSRFENDINSKIDSAKNPDSIETMTYKTIRHYTVVFAAGVLPVRKIKKKKPFCWENCEELNRLAELNHKINAGVTLTTLRNEFAALEKSVAEKESQLAELKKGIDIFRDLYNRGERCFKYHSQNETDLMYLAKNNVTAENYHLILELIPETEAEIAELERSLPEERTKLKDTADTLSLMEKVAGSTFVQGIIDEEKHRRQTHIKSGLKDAEGSFTPTPDNQPKRN